MASTGDKNLPLRGGTDEADTVLVSTDGVNFSRAAVLTFDSLDFRKMIFQMVRPAGLWAKGKITAEGSWVDALKFLGRFDTSG